MKNIKLIIALLLALSTICSAQKVATLIPSIGAEPDFSKYAQKEFERRNVLASKKDITQKEQKELNELWEKYGETIESIYDPEGGGCSWYCGGGPNAISTSSYLPNYKSISYNSSNAHDFDLSTAWVENDTQYGIGEYLEYRFDKESARITTIIIYNGYTKNKTAWQNNSRVKTLNVVENGKTIAKLKLQNTRARQTFKLPKPLGKRADKKDLVLRFEILEVYPGKKHKDTAISELYFDGLDVHCFVAGTKVLMGNGPDKNIEDIKVGDIILAYDIKKKRHVLSQVEGIAKKEHCNLVKYTFANQKSIIATDDHPFLLKDLTWASFNPEKTEMYVGYDSIKNIHVGNSILQLGQSTRLDHIQPLHKKQTTYTITKLSNGDAFFANGFAVGAEGLRSELLVKENF